MKPKWQKLDSPAREYAHSSFSSLVQSLLPKDTYTLPQCIMNITQYSHMHFPSEKS